MKNNNCFKVLVANSSSVFCFGLSTLLKNVPYIKKVEEASNEDEIFTILENDYFDIVFIESQMHKSIDIIHKIINQYSKVKIITVLINEKFIYEDDILNCGAQGFILRDCNINEIINALDEVCHDKIYFTPHLLNLIAIHKNYKIELKKTSLADKNILAIMYLMYHEKASKEIAIILNLSCRTVEDYRMKILRKTNSENMIGVIKYVFENGIHKDEFLNNRFGNNCIKKNHQAIDYIR